MAGYRRKTWRQIYRFLGSVEYWLFRRFTPAGQLVLASLMVFAVVGVDTNQSMAYQVFTFLASLLAISMTWGFFFKARITASRLLPRFCTAGQPFVYRIHLENNGRALQANLAVIEDFYEVQYLPDQGPVQPLKVLPHYARRGKFTLVPVTALAPGDECEVSVEITPRRRGRLYLRAIQIACPDPLGLFRAMVTLPDVQSLISLPTRYPVPDLSLSGTRKYQSGGVALASSIGDSGEFIGLREYRPGDPLRRIHWKSWAKVGKPIVKEYQDEFFVRHALVLDTFKGTQSSQSFEAAVSLAASFACAVDTQESLLDLMFVGLQSYCFTAGRGVDHIDRMLEILASVRPCREQPFSALPAMVLSKSVMLSSCICVLLDWNQERRDLIERLRAIGVPVLALVVTADGQVPGAPDSGGGDVHWLSADKLQEGLGRL